MRHRIRWHDGRSMALRAMGPSGEEVSAPAGWYYQDRDGATGGLRWFGPHAAKHDMPAFLFFTKPD